MLGALERLQAKLMQREEWSHSTAVGSLRVALQSPLFNHILTLQHSIKHLKSQVGGARRQRRGLSLVPASSSSPPSHSSCLHLSSPSTLVLLLFLLFYLPFPSSVVSPSPAPLSVFLLSPPPLLFFLVLFLNSSLLLSSFLFSNSSSFSSSLIYQYSSSHLLPNFLYLLLLCPPLLSAPLSPPLQ